MDSSGLQRTLGAGPSRVCIGRALRAEWIAGANTAEDAGLVAQGIGSIKNAVQRISGLRAFLLISGMPYRLRALMRPLTPNL
jgi:hypothetical protein